MKRKLRGFSRWVFKKKTKKLKVKIVHPGGHVELHNRPVLASEIMLRNPRCCVTHPYIFKQPSAIVSPDATLFPGQKYYVVPFGTIRKLQKLSNFTTNTNTNTNTDLSVGSQDEVNETGEDCQKSTYLCFNFFKVKIPFLLMKKGGKRKGNGNKGRNFGGEVRSSSSSSSSSHGSSSSSESMTHEFIRKRSSAKALKRLSSLDNWQPNLESISEE